MQGSILEKITIERGLIYIVIFAVLIVFAFIFYLFFGQLSKNIQLQTPNGGEEWEIGETYQITWKTRGIERVGIVLFKGKEPKWVGKNIDAKSGKYDWKIYPGQEYGDDYWVAVFEYPWQKGNKIDFSDGALAVVYPELGSCDSLSIEQEWPYFPSDLPDIRRVFITENSFTGDLEGLEGADQKCQQEAEEKGFKGKWQAFIGGDSEQEFAIARMNQTPRKTKGVFVVAQPAAALIRGATCHRLLGKNLDEFLAKFSELEMLNKEKLEKSFFDNFAHLWLGKIDEKSKKNCAAIGEVLSSSYSLLVEKYSFTTTCQNWTKGNRVVDGYPVPDGQPKPSFPSCYTPEGKLTDAVALGGLSSGLVGSGNNAVFTPYQGMYCNSHQNLLCIEE